MNCYYNYSTAVQWHVYFDNYIIQDWLASCWPVCYKESVPAPETLATRTHPHIAQSSYSRSGNREDSLLGTLSGSPVPPGERKGGNSQMEPTDACRWELAGTWESSLFFSADNMPWYKVIYSNRLEYLYKIYIYILWILEVMWLNFDRVVTTPSGSRECERLYRLSWQRGWQPTGMNGTAPSQTWWRSRHHHVHLPTVFCRSYMSDGQNYWLTYLVTAWP